LHKYRHAGLPRQEHPRISLSIGIKLRKSTRQKLKSSWACFSFSNNAARKRSKHKAQSTSELSEIRQGSQEVKGIFTKRAGGFDKTPILQLPATKQQNPMLNQSQQEFGINLAEDLVRLLGTPMIHRQLGFPELEKQFNLPTEALQTDDIAG